MNKIQYSAKALKELNELDNKTYLWQVLKIVIPNEAKNPGSFKINKIDSSLRYIKNDSQN